jgi:hypothetical protein
MRFGKRLLKLWNKGDTMNIYAVLGELLYIISNYEKGRIRTRGFWTRKYTVSLNESLYCMSIILQLMRTPTNIPQSKLLSIKEFCKKNEFVVFPRGDLTRLDDIVNVLQIDNLSDENDCIICKMNSIVNECIMLLKGKSKGYKDRLSCLIKAFHNLPRVFLDCSKQTVYNINAKSIQAQDALLYASSYIDLDML